MKPCRPHAPAYCFEMYSSLLQHRRFQCTATMDQCVAHREGWTKEVLPEDHYVFSPCTEQP